ncbi:MAG: hypothetical protein EBU49_00310 [Proteobacteria bacterium]|nr:hypothetical protein [Pseudomonadota bacterium]
MKNQLVTPQARATRQRFSDVIAGLDNDGVYDALHTALRWQECATDRAMSVAIGTMRRIIDRELDRRQEAFTSKTGA